MIQYCLFNHRSIEPLPRSVERTSSEATDLFWAFSSTGQARHCLIERLVEPLTVCFFSCCFDQATLINRSKNLKPPISDTSLSTLSKVQDKACSIICLKLTSSLKLLALALTVDVLEVSSHLICYICIAHINPMNICIKQQTQGKGV